MSLIALRVSFDGALRPIFRTRSKPYSRSCRTVSRKVDSSSSENQFRELTSFLR